jgi:hypothetical protein
LIWSNIKRWSKSSFNRTKSPKNKGSKGLFKSWSSSRKSRRRSWKGRNKKKYEIFSSEGLKSPTDLRKSSTIRVKLNQTLLKSVESIFFIKFSYTSLNKKFFYQIKEEEYQAKVVEKIKQEESRIINQQK